MTIDWSKPIEAYHPDGAIRSVCLVGEQVSAPKEYRAEGIDPDACDEPIIFFADGRHKYGTGWRIRNVAEPNMGNPISLTPQLSSEVVERMVALLRRLLLRTSSYLGDEANEREDAEMLREARAILAEIEPVDEDLIEARNLIADAVSYGSGIVGDPERKRPTDFRDGTCDEGDLVKRALAGIRRNRELEREVG